MMWHRREHRSSPLFPACRFGSFVPAFEPPLRSIRKTVEPGYVRLDIDDGREVEGIYPADVEDGIAAFEEASDGEAYAVWPAGMARGEYSVRRVVEEGGADEPDLSRAVKDIDEDDMGESFDIPQSFLVFGEYLDPAGPFRPKRALDGCIVLCGVRGMDRTYGF